MRLLKVAYEKALNLAYTRSPMCKIYTLLPPVNTSSSATVSALSFELNTNVSASSGVTGEHVAGIDDAKLSGEGSPNVFYKGQSKLFVFQAGRATHVDLLHFFRMRCAA